MKALGRLLRRWHARWQPAQGQPRTERPQPPLEADTAPFRRLSPPLAFPIVRPYVLCTAREWIALRPYLARMGTSWSLAPGAAAQGWC